MTFILNFDTIVIYRCLGGKYMNINKLKSELIAQRESKFKGNIYHYSQVNFAYNSNKIEGGKLTEEQIHLFLKVILLLNWMI